MWLGKNFYPHRNRSEIMTIMSYVYFTQLHGQVGRQIGVSPDSDPVEKSKFEGLTFSELDFLHVAGQM